MSNWEHSKTCITTSISKNTNAGSDNCLKINLLRHTDKSHSFHLSLVCISLSCGFLHTEDVLSSQYSERSALSGVALTRQVSVMIPLRCLWMSSSSSECHSSAGDANKLCKHRLTGQAENDAALLLGNLPFASSWLVILHVDRRLSTISWPETCQRLKPLCLGSK